MVTKRDLATRLADECNISIAYATAMIDSVFEVLGEFLYDKREDVTLGKYGQFRQKVRKGRVLKIPTTGEEMYYKGKAFVKFFQPRSTIGEGVSIPIDGGEDDEEA